MANKFLTRRFEAVDTYLNEMQEKEHTGFISFSDMQKIFHGTSWLTTKEINLILRRYAMDQG